MVYFQQRHKPIPKSFRIFVIDSFHYAFNVYFETKQKSETDDFSQNYKIRVPSELKQTHFRNFIPQVQLMFLMNLPNLLNHGSENSLWPNSDDHVHIAQLLN